MMTSSSKLIQSLRNIYPFNEEELQQFQVRLKFRELKKDTFLLKQGQISGSIAFINKGSLRLYTETERNDLTINFFTENCWVADLESLLLQQPSRNYIEAFEDTDLATISLADIHALMDNYPRFRMLNSLLSGLTVTTTHLVSIITKSPDQRYKELIATSP